jgi:ABC-2 type transport system permease protein
MRLKASIIKEFLVLLRDIPGLIVLFIMPVAMIIVISLVQDTTIQSLKGTKINILYTDYDQDILGETLRTGLEKSELFNITDTLSDMSTLKQIVADEDFRIAVIIPKHSTNIIRKNIEPFISGLFTGEIAESDSIQSSEIIILSDPTTKENFRNSIKLALETYTAKIETQILLKLLAEKSGINDRGTSRFNRSTLRSSCVYRTICLRKRE